MLIVGERKCLPDLRVYLFRAALATPSSRRLCWRKKNTLLLSTETELCLSFINRSPKWRGLGKNFILKTTDKKIKKKNLFFVQALICRTKLWTEPWFFLSKEFRKKKKVDLDSGKTCRRGTCALLLCSLGQRSPLIRRTSTVQRCMWMMTIRKMC